MLQLPQCPLQPSEVSYHNMSSGRIPSVEGGIQPTIVDAKGDIIAATAADTVSRLAVGANDTVLTADSSTATGLKWAAPAAGAGNLALITSGSLTGTSLSVSSLSSYTNIYIYFDAVSWTTSTADNTRLRINGTSTSVYRTLGFNAYGPSGLNRNGITTDTGIILTRPTTQNYFSESNSFVINLFNCKNTGYTSWNLWSSYIDEGGSNRYNYVANGVFESSAAVSSIEFKTVNSYTFATGTYRIYGE